MKTGALKTWRERLSRYWLDFLEDLWTLETAQLRGARRTLIRGVRVVNMVWRGFRTDECQLHASALTYFTLMSLVPVLALGLSLARVFGGENLAREKVISEISAWGEQMADGTAASGASESAMVSDFVGRMTHYADRMFDQIASIGFGTLGGIGLAALIWMAISMLSQVERSFNRVWNAPPRKLWRKFADYLSVVLVVPFLALAASTIPVAGFFSQHVGGFFGAIPGAEGMAMLLKRSVVAVLTTAVFVFVLMFVPNTRVKIKPGIVGGVATAILFVVWMRICASLQIGVVKYSKIYGGFATLPIVLAWTYVSWQIILFGSELSFAVQNADTYGREQDARHASIRARWQLALGLAVELARCMVRGKPLVAMTFAGERHIAVRLMNQVLETLENAGLIVETARNPGNYVLAHDPAHLTAREVVDAIVGHGVSPEKMGLGNLDQGTRDILRRAEDAWGSMLDRPLLVLAGATDGKMLA